MCNFLNFCSKCVTKEKEQEQEQEKEHYSSLNKDNSSLYLLDVGDPKLLPILLARRAIFLAFKLLGLLPKVIQEGKVTVFQSREVT